MQPGLPLQFAQVSIRATLAHAPPGGGNYVCQDRHAESIDYTGSKFLPEQVENLNRLDQQASNVVMLRGISDEKIEINHNTAQHLNRRQIRSAIQN